MLVISPAGRRAYTANLGAGSESALELAKRSLIVMVPVAKRAQHISMSPDGRGVFAHGQEAPRIAVVVTPSNQIADWVSLSAPVYASELRPYGLSLLVLRRTSALHVIDLQSFKMVPTLKVSEGGSEILVRPGAQVAYITGIGAGEIEVLDLRP